jgi:murein DD-endopeptidase MepM/ murein hydrolase activator NlpD
MGGGAAMLFGHCSSLKVKKGDYAAAGQIIAYVGSTGMSTGPHLHFEVRLNGKAVNPMDWVIY